MKKINVDIKLFFDSSIYNLDFMDRVQSFIVDEPTQLFDGIYLKGLKKTKHRIDLNEDCLYTMLDKYVTDTCPVFELISEHVGFDETQLGLAEFEFSSSNLAMIINYNDLSFVPSAGRWLWGNSITFQLITDSTEGVLSSGVCEKLFLSACERFQPSYARICDQKEYEVKNMLDSPSIMAVGVDISRYLPGLYWGNYFGVKYKQLLVGDKLLNCGAQRSFALGQGIAMFLSEKINTWSLPEYQNIEAKVLKCVGKEYFFGKSDRLMPSIGLDIGMPDLLRNPRFY